MMGSLKTFAYPFLSEGTLCYFSRNAIWKTAAFFQTCPAFSIPKPKQKTMANFTKERFEKQREPEQKRKSMETDHQTSRPKIQRVPHHLRDRNKFAKYYSPKLVSFGPIHYGKPHLQLGERYKEMWALMYLRSTNKRDEELRRMIREKIENLKGLYTKDAIAKFDDEKLLEILLVDGCSLLQILYKFDFLKPIDLSVKVDQLALVQQDVLLLENQLPFELLKILADDNDPWKAMAKFINCFNITSLDEPEAPKRALSCCRTHEPQEFRNTLTPPPHLLHQLRDFLLSDFALEKENPEHKSSRTHRNIKEPKEAGIRVKRINNPSSPIDINFHSTWFGGRLELPEIVVDNTIVPKYLNLIAYEMCPDFENNYEISSFVEFLDSLIDYPEDVKELRAAGVLHNRLGSDNEVAELFNIISSDLVPTSTFASARNKIETHYKKKRKTWFAQAYHTYFNSPWSIISVLAAFLGLLLTAVQTWFVVYGSISK